MFQPLGKLLRRISAIGRIEKVIANNLAKVVQARRKIFETYTKMDLIQLLLQQDQIRQQTDGVCY